VLVRREMTRAFRDHKREQFRGWTTVQPRRTGWLDYSDFCRAIRSQHPHSEAALDQEGIEGWASGLRRPDGTGDGQDCRCNGRWPPHFDVGEADVSQRSAVPLLISIHGAANDPRIQLHARARKAVARSPARGGEVVTIAGRAVHNPLGRISRQRPTPDRVDFSIREGIGIPSPARRGEPGDKGKPSETFLSSFPIRPRAQDARDIAFTRSLRTAATRTWR